VGQSRSDVRRRIGSGQGLGRVRQAVPERSICARAHRQETFSRSPYPLVSRGSPEFRCHDIWLAQGSYGGDSTSDRLGHSSVTEERPQMVVKTNTRGPLKEPWHAVSIVAGSKACPDATRLSDRRFLSREAPALPLAQCSWPSLCKCTYRHYADRRAVLRRETDRGRFPRPRFGEERREGTHGRRADDSD